MVATKSAARVERGRRRPTQIALPDSVVTQKGVHVVEKRGQSKQAKAIPTLGTAKPLDTASVNYWMTLRKDDCRKRRRSFAR